MVIRKAEYKDSQKVKLRAEISASNRSDDSENSDAQEEEEDKKSEVDGQAENERPAEKKKKRKGKNGKPIPRVKERKLSVIIAKVKKWRDLYYGYSSQEGSKTRFSLEDAAKMVNLPKKTLDDYLQQLKIGKKYGFDFNKYKDHKIGVLREFVKEQKAKLQPENQDGEEEKTPVKEEEGSGKEGKKGAKQKRAKKEPGEENKRKRKMKEKGDKQSLKSEPNV